MPFPADLQSYASMVDFKETQDHPLDSILSLPTELSDLIFSFLSIPALDAARYACRAWYSKITGILTSVLRKAGSGELLKYLDVGVNCLCLIADPSFAILDVYVRPHRLHPPIEDSNTWQARFRVKTSRFFISPVTRDKHTK